MKKTLHISPDITLPLDSVTQTFAILAKRRVGKTYTASVLAEEMAKAGLPFVVLDPTGAWWGLRSSADGRSEGLPVVIIGGQHGDLPLEATSGKVIAELVVEHPGFYVIDLSDTESDAAQDRFATAFAQRLYRLKDKHRDPLHLFIDEADSFAPQRPLEGQKVMLGAFEALVRRGGIRGIGMTLITQRPAVLNKNVLTQCEVIIALQTTAPQDQDAIDDWVKRNGTEEQRRELMSSLASLKQGEAWFYSPAWLEAFSRIRVRERETFNSSATPKVGERKLMPQKLAPVDLEQLKGKIADSIQRAKENDPEALRREKAELQRQIAELKKEQKAVPPAEPKIITVPAVEPAELERLEALLKNYEALLGRADELAGQHSELAARFAEERDALGAQGQLLQDALARATAAATAPAPARPDDRGRRDAARRQPAQPTHAGRGQGAGAAPSGGESGEGLSRMARSILTALAQHPEGLTKGQILLHTGYAASGKVSTAFAALTRDGLIEGSGGMQRITPRGLDELGDFVPLPVGDALREELLGGAKLNTMEKALLRAACASYPAPARKGEILQAAGYAASGKVSTAFARLARYGYLEKAGAGALRASDALFG